MEWRQATIDHIQKVQHYCSLMVARFANRFSDHDRSKLEEPEAPTFARVTGKLHGLTFGSEEYKQALVEMGPALDHHYAHNRHHPEYFEDGIQGMDLLDIVEMVADWYAASQRHANGDIMKSLDINQERFGFSDDLKAVMANTVKLIQETETEGWTGVTSNAGE